jgi:hypothetical protein
MKLHDGQEFSKNIMSQSFYHEFSANKIRSANARYLKEQQTPEKAARSLAYKI